MPDIDPAALSRPSISLSTPILATKSLAASVSSSQKVTKTSQIIPARIDLEPLYAALKSAIGVENWVVYKESTTEFLIGRLNQAEYSERIDPILSSPNGEKDHMHNQLIAAIYGNVTREMPDQGLAPWVSANDKPTAPVGSKPVTGDAAERRLKGEVMQLPSRDRRRIKDLVQNEFDPYETLSNTFIETQRPRPTDVPPSAGGINNMNFDLEIRKRFTQPLAIESLEFPDISVVEGRMLPFCYEAGLASGHSQDAAMFVTIATESYIKEVMSGFFSRTRSNGPGETGSAGFGFGSCWIQTHKYRKQLAHEEDAALRGDIARDKSGLLPVEAKAASERGPLTMADLRIALDMGDAGMSNFPVLTTAITNGYREEELERWGEYTWIPEQDGVLAKPTRIHDAGVNGSEPINPLHPLHPLPNGDTMDLDSEIWWEGADGQDMSAVDSLLDTFLAGNS